MHTITPHLIVQDGRTAVEFYKKAFGAEVEGVHQNPEGKVTNAQLRIGDARLMLGDEFHGMGSCQSPQTLGGTSAIINLYTQNVDQLFNRAVAAGATVTIALANHFWGDRSGQIKDPFGHTWALGEKIEDVAPQEMERRARAAFECSESGKAHGSGA